MADELLSVEGLTKHFGALAAVEDVGFAAAEGEIVGIIGPNGAGKTTLFNLVSGFLRPDRGTVVLDGRDVTGWRPHRVARLGLQRTFQTARPLRGESVLDNVVAGTHLHGRNGVLQSLFGTPRGLNEERDAYATALDLLSRVGLADHADRFPSELSAGQLRLLEIARTLAGRPRLLLLDEPAAGLNDDETRALEATLRSVRAGGTALVIVEHDVELVLRLSDRVLVLNFGRVLTTGSPGAVRSDPAVAEAYFGTRVDISDVTGGSQ